MIHKIDKCEKCKNQPICKYTEVYTAYTTLMVQSLDENEVLKNLIELGAHCIYKPQVTNESCNKPTVCY